jgi:hypothetical protein
VACQEYTWPVTGITYTDSDEITETVGNVTNILYLTILPGTSDETVADTVTSTSPYIWFNGLEYTASGSYSTVYPCNGFTYTFYLELTIVPPTTTTTSSTSTSTSTSTSSSTTTTTTTIAPTTTTTTTVIYSAGFSVGTENNALACLETVPVITLYSTSSTFAFGSFVYTDPGLTTIFIGGNLSYKNILANNVIRVPDSGQINGNFSC